MLLRIARVVKYSVDYYIDNDKLKPVTDFKDLGVNISSDFSWHNHVISKIKRANSLLGFIKRSYGYNASMKSKRILYFIVDSYCSNV